MPLYIVENFESRLGSPGLKVLMALLEGKVQVLERLFLDDDLLLSKRLRMDI